jgi:hypothetical protein
LPLRGHPGRGYCRSGDRNNWKDREKREIMSDVPDPDEDIDLDDSDEEEEEEDDD